MSSSGYHSTSTRCTLHVAALVVTSNTLVMATTISIGHGQTQQPQHVGDRRRQEAQERARQLQGPRAGRWR